MNTMTVVHSEWLKIRSLRGVFSSLWSMVLVTVAITLLVSATIGRQEAGAPGADLLFGAFYALNFGQIAAMAFGATALSSEFLGEALRTSLTAVPRRGLFYCAKMTTVGALALVAGMITSLLAFVGGQLFLGDVAIGLTHPGVLRAVLGGGLYLCLIALFAAGLTAMLRSAVVVLSILIPFLLVVSFVVGDVAGGVAQYLPDRAGQLILHQHQEGSLGPWTGLGVLFLWTAAAQLAGWWMVRTRDA
ncbi:ABC transporter permease [uncultured Streptomyces sp.]|uniref:ABC transporter permease n=1 Tax=uncultured Streptomyces sp. TaxID=174707 RepID=UPI002631DC7F|nr:ABC transporter permease [uncultured Streptomyces sp.]